MNNLEPQGNINSGHYILGKFVQNNRAVVLEKFKQEDNCEFSMVTVERTKEYGPKDLAVVVIVSQHPECWIKGEEAIKIVRNMDDEFNFDLEPYGKERVHKVDYGTLTEEGTISDPIDISPEVFVSLGRPEKDLSLQRRDTYKVVKK
ncbi:MAG: hypothetical protein KKF39_03855 [Nanoarchaeota archaeon]|nr:hypothetical protein [Nanoarchaeota archaeon]